MSSFTNVTKSTSSFDSETKSGYIGYILAEETGDSAFTMVGALEDFALVFDDGITWDNGAKASGAAWYNREKSS